MQRIFYKRAVSGFTLFEVIVAIFVMLFGLIGVASVFSAGMRARMRAQELIVSQELGNMWAEMVRFRLEAEGLAAGDTLTIGSLDGAKGRFDREEGSLVGGAIKFPTYDINVYFGYSWEVVSIADYKPKWAPEDGSADKDWDERLDGSSIYPGGWPGLNALSQVELRITRGARRYSFTYIFSRVGMKYNAL